MKKILYIRIDNTPVPQVLKDEIEEFDCRQINDFCSFVGYAIIEDLKNNAGTPYYRLIRPVGLLLMNFKTENVGLFDAIISQWANIFGDILHKGVSENVSYAIRFPQEYIDWLCQNEDDHFSYIVNNLKKNNAIISLDAHGLMEDVISVLRLKIERYLQTNNNEFDYIVFSNPHIGNGSEIVKRLKDVFGNFHFLKLEQCEQIFEYEKYRGHEYVDLGLPSGLKWATCNVGASKPSEHGDYYAWGEISTKASYDEDNCETYGKELDDISGKSFYDAARANWGGIWRMPTVADFQELLDVCTWKWTSQNSHNGYFVKGPNGRTIFLPATGQRYETSLNSADELGYYWSASPYESYSCWYAYSLYLSDHDLSVEEYGREGGHSVRPVAE